MHNQGKCQKDPKHVTPLSQCDASAQERQQEQVFSSREKINSGWNVTHPTHSHVSSLHVLGFSSVLKSFALKNGVA